MLHYSKLRKKIINKTENKLLKFYPLFIDVLYGKYLLIIYALSFLMWKKYIKRSSKLIFNNNND
jgi:hypothetical protein